MCPRTFRDYIIPPQVEVEEEIREPAVLCLKNTAFVHKENRFVLCVFCYGSLPPIDKSSFCIKLRHTLSIGNIIDEVSCSSCSRKITSIGNLSNCLTCQRAYVIYNHSVDNYPTNTDGCVVITIRDDTYQSSEEISEFL